MLGPLPGCIFDARIGRYLLNIRNAADKACLRAFFRQLMTPVAIACKYRRLGSGFVVSICNHLILIKPRLFGGFLVANIKPTGGQWHI